MAAYKVRWYDPRRPGPLVKWFYGRNTKRRAQEFRDRLPFLSEIIPDKEAPRHG